MSSRAGALLDTSFFIRREHGPVVTAPPSMTAISVVTLAELHLGVLVSGDANARARRLATLADAEATYSALPVDRAVARAWGSLIAAARRLGRRPSAFDGLVAATAVVHGLTVYTFDAGFRGIPGVDVVVLE